MKKLFLFLLLFNASTVSAEYFLVRELHFEGGQFQGVNFKPEYNLPSEEKLQHSTAIVWNVDMYRYYDITLFWDNRVEAWATDRQYRTTFWDFDIGVAFPRVDVLFRHKSEHYLDDKMEGHFPLQNRVIMRVKFINKPRR